MIEQPIVIKILNNDVQLDNRCWACNSQYEPTDGKFNDENGLCTICHGVGFIPTEVGKGILEFVSRHINNQK